MAATEPSQDPSYLWHNSLERPMLFGCYVCPDREICGGLNIAPGMFSCRDLCCGHPQNCQFVCHCKPEERVARSIEVGGWSFDNVPRGPALTYPSLPTIVPYIQHGYCRRKPLQTSAVAVPLAALFRRSTGQLKFTSRAQVAEKFRLAQGSKLIIVGIDEDQPIETYWSKGRGADIASNLTKLEPDLVTVPNYSVALDVPRWDNLYSMKKIVRCWHELVANGMPTALHVNARTDHDWTRWDEFIRQHDEVQTISFEFGTGAASPERGVWYAAHLAHLPKVAARPLQLVTKGGRQYLAAFKQSFAEVVFIETDTFVRTMKRFRASSDHATGIVDWENAPTAYGEPLDDLLQWNVEQITHCRS